MLDHYLHSAHAAARLLKPERDPIDLIERSPGTIVTELPAADRAWAWLASEHHVLLACVRESVAGGLDRHAWQLAWTIKTYLYRRGYWPEQMATERIAADAAGRSGDLRGRGAALFSLAEAYVRLNRLDEAWAGYEETRKAYAAAGDLSGEADTFLGMTELAGIQGQYADGLRYARRALELFRRIGDTVGTAVSLNNVGWDQAELGEHQQALTSCREALALVQDLGMPEAHAACWHTMGFAHHGLADYRQAEICYRHALDLFDKTGDRYLVGRTLDSIGDVHRDAGDTGAARQAWTRALRILDEMSHLDADRVRAKLNSA